jgi:tetratricopeptide (TPR) repeat protein
MSAAPLLTPYAAPAGPERPTLLRYRIPSSWSQPAEVLATSSIVKARSASGPSLGFAVAVVALAAVAVTTLARPQWRAFAQLPDFPDLPHFQDAAKRPAALPIPARAEEQAPAASPLGATAASTERPLVPLALADVPVPARAPEADAVETPPPTAAPRSTPRRSTPKVRAADKDAVRPPAVRPASAAPVVLSVVGELAELDEELPGRKKAKRLTTRALASLRKGDLTGAERALTGAVLIDPSLANAWRYLGMTRAQLEDVDGARAAYRKYLELSPRAPDAAKVRSFLAK